MEFGIFSNSRRPTRNQADTWKEDLFEVALADELGMEEAWISEHVSPAEHLLHDQLGWTWQRPARRAVERNDEAIEHWVKKRWPQMKKGHGARTR